jgi:hypothetical protein
MILSKHYAAASRDIVSESFDGDFVVLDLSCGKYFSFSDSGNVLWEAISSGVAPQSLLRAAAGPTSHADLEAFVGKLIEYGLIAERSNGIPPEATEELLSRLALSSEKPDLSVFDDLADLFLADPIHDVEEEAGWPAMKQA